METQPVEDHISKELVSWGSGVKRVSELIFFFFSETILFLSVPFFLFSVSICDLWDLIDIVLCSLSHPLPAVSPTLYQHSLVGQVNLITGAQSLPIQSPRPTLGKGQDVACATHTGLAFSPHRAAGPSQGAHPFRYLKSGAFHLLHCGYTTHGQGNGTKEITLALQAPRWGKSTSGPKGCSCWGQKVTTH